MKTLDPKLLDEVVKRITEAIHPEQIYLYGSHAYGTPHQDSDVDLLVIIGSTTVPSHKRARPVYKALRRFPVPAEISIVTKDEFARRVKWIVSAERDAFKKGKLLYDRAP